MADDGSKAIVEDGLPSVRAAGLLRALTIVSLSETATAGALREKCRKGDPFPLIAYQWPNLLVTEPGDAKFFQGELDNPDNPCLRLDDWQRTEVIQQVFDATVSEVAMKGNTRPGKGCAVAIAACLWFDCYDPGKVIISSASFAHASKVLFGEIAKWRRSMQEPAIGTLLKGGISDHDQHYMQVSNPDSAEAFSGQHGPATLFVFDESTQVPKERYEDAQKQARTIVAIGNPRTLYGWFHDLWTPCGFDKDATQTVTAPSGKRRCVTVGGLDCMNVRHKRLEKPVAPIDGIEIDGEKFTAGTPLPQWAFRRVKSLIPNQCDLARFRSICHHADPRHVDVFAHGRFPREDPEKQVILPSWLPRHIDAWRAAKGVIAVDSFGFDVAASLDGDSSILAAGSSEGCAGLDEWKQSDVVAHASRILRIAKDKYGIDLTDGQVPVTVDVVGLGKGSADKLRELGVFVIEFNGGARSEFPEYINLRAESYAMLGRRLNPLDTFKDEPWLLPDDMELHEDLCSPDKIHPGGDITKFKLRAKDEIAATLGRSPDKGDAVTYLFHGVRWCGEWGAHVGRDIIASGEDIEEERRHMTTEEVAEIDDPWLKDILQTQRVDQGHREDW